MNPWLQAKLVKKKGRYSLNFKKSCDSLRSDTFSCTEDSTLNPHLNNAELAAKLVKYCVKVSIQCINKNEPLFRVTLIKISDKQFALLFSLSHTLGDGHTFYSLYGMLSNGIPAKALIAERKHEAASQLLQSSTAKWLLGMGMTSRFVSRMIIPQRDLKRKTVAVNPKWIESEKSKHQEAFQSESERDPTFPSFISTNDIITTWYFQASRCHVGLMFMNFRNRAEGMTDELAGNYESVIAYQSQDFASPHYIRRSIPIERRFHEHIPLPGIWHTTTKKIAAITSWVSFYVEIQLSSPTTKHLYHAPVIQKSPNEAIFDIAIIFCPKKGEYAILTFATDHTNLSPPFTEP
jgi:hypothetical protein